MQTFLKKSFFFICLILTSFSSRGAVADSISPTKPPSSFHPEYLFTGGSLAMSFGTFTYVDVSPLLGYRFTPKFSVGTGFTYIYFKDNRAPITNSSTNYGSNSSSIYGGRLFSRYLIFESLFAHAEYEVLNREVYNELFRKNLRVNVVALYLGGGYQQRIGMNSFMNLMVLWNVNETRYSLYPNPIIRAGFNIGF
jgi:hypothetical protein